MTLTEIILMGAGLIALVGSLIILVLKKLLENIDNVDEDENGVFFDKRDML